MKKEIIHPTAVIEDSVSLGDGVCVGPYAVIRENVSIGSGTQVNAHSVIEGNTTIGKDCRIGIGAVIGNPPQDLKYDDEATEVIIGDRTVIREYVTINRGTTHRMKTVVGSDVLLMSYVHVAHDCIVGNNVILANCVTLAGHVTVEDSAIVGGLTPIHQFVTVGKMSIVGGGSRVPKDIPPYCRLAGNPLKVSGLNTIGLTRRNYSKKQRELLTKAYKTLFRSGLNTTQAIEYIEKNLEITDEISYLLDFIKRSERGICKS